jgi:hypothetical protein
MLIWFIAHLVLFDFQTARCLSQCVHLQLIKNGTKYFFVHQTSCSTIKNVQHSLWNIHTFESFKYKLKQHYYKNAKPPSYYNIGNRYLNILHTRIRNNCSTLHNDLFHANLIHSSSWSCGYSTENAEHFFIVLQQVWCTKKYFVPFFISCKCTHWLKHLAVWKSKYKYNWT